MVFHNLYSLRAKGQNPLCGKPSAVVHSHTPRTDWSPPFRPWVWCQGKWLNVASVFARRCSFCASPILLYKSFKGADFNILRMGRRKVGFLESLVVLLWVTIVWKMFAWVFFSASVQVEGLAKKHPPFPMQPVHERQTTLFSQEL